MIHCTILNRKDLFSILDNLDSDEALGLLKSSSINLSDPWFALFDRSTDPIRLWSSSSEEDLRRRSQSLCWIGGYRTGGDLLRAMQAGKLKEGDTLYCIEQEYTAGQNDFMLIVFYDNERNAWRMFSQIITDDSAYRHIALTKRKLVLREDGLPAPGDEAELLEKYHPQNGLASERDIQDSLANFTPELISPRKRPKPEPAERTNSINPKKNHKPDPAIEPVHVIRTPEKQADPETPKQDEVLLEEEIFTESEDGATTSLQAEEIPVSENVPEADDDDQTDEAYGQSAGNEEQDEPVHLDEVREKQSDPASMEVMEKDDEPVQADPDPVQLSMNQEESDPVMSGQASIVSDTPEPESPPAIPKEIQTKKNRPKYKKHRRRRR